MSLRPSHLLVLLVLTGAIQGCASSLRPIEEARLDAHRAAGADLRPVKHRKNPWVAGALGVTAPFCNLYLAYGTGRNEQLPMALINLAVWPFSVAWAIPGCVLDTTTVNALSYLVEHPENPGAALE